MPKNRKRILLVSVNWLGDLLFLTPAIRAVRRAYPDSFIVALSPRRGLDFLKGNPHLNAVIPMPEGRGISHLAGWLPLISRLRAERFDTAFLFHRSFTRAAVVWAAGIPERIGTRTTKRGWPREIKQVISRGWLLTTAVEMPPPDTLHKVDLMLRVVEGAGIPADGRLYDPCILPEDTQAADVLVKELGIGPSDRIVALHAGANWLLKRWPARRFGQLADQLSERYGAKVLFIGGEKDRPLIERISGRMRTRPLVAAGRTTFRQMGALLKRTKLLISNDSGPLHMGMAAGVPVVALFGPTDPALSGPVRPWSNGLNGAKATVLFGSIGCPVPCYRLDCPANLCMEQISVDQVLEAASRFLDG